MNFADLADELQSDVTGAPLPLLERELVRAAREWGKRTRSFVVRGQISAANGVLDATTLLGTDQSVFAVNWVSPAAAGGHLGATTAHRRSRHGGDPTATGTAVEFSRAGSSIMPYPAPVDGTTFDVSLCVLPTRSAATLADDFSDRWADDIINLAAARLFATPEKPWSNGQQAGYHRALYEQAAAEAEADVASGGGQRVPRAVVYGGL